MNPHTPESQRLALDASLSDSQFASAICPHMPIDPGITRAVRAMWAAGVECFESCDGGDGHSFKQPTVRFHGGQSAGWRALTACAEIALPVYEIGRVWDVIDGEPTGPHWQIMFRPVCVAGSADNETNTP